MVDSGIGRTELPEIGQGRLQARALPEAQDGHVREPAPLLRLVDAQPLQALEEVLGQARRRSGKVAQDEHANAPALAIVLGHEADRACNSGRLTHCRKDRLELLHRTVAEKGQRDVQVVADDRPAAANVCGLPAAQSAERLLGEAEGAEQTRAVTALKASGELHPDSSRLCCRSRRTRWSAVTVARRRIESRSPGKTKSALRSPSGPTAWR